VLDLVPYVPTPVWGRDELGAGEMWNSNSFISWLLERCGLDVESIRLPAGGRAPGWNAGLVIARRRKTGSAACGNTIELELKLEARARQVEVAACAPELVRDDVVS
jgi:hypothetical protein